MSSSPRLISTGVTSTSSGGAIQAQIDGKTYRQAALDIGGNPNTFQNYMKRTARMLSAAYAQLPCPG